VIVLCVLAVVVTGLIIRTVVGIARAEFCHPE